MKKLLLKTKLFFVAPIIVLIAIVGFSTQVGAQTLFTQNFDAATSVAYAANTVTAYTTATGGIFGSGANQFTSMTGIAKATCGFAINSTTSYPGASPTTGNLANYGNNTSYYWSLERTTNFAATAPTAIKMAFDIYFYCISSGSNQGVNFAIGSGLADGYNTATLPSASLMHSAFSISSNSTAMICTYGTATTISGSSSLTSNAWKSMVWVMNNSGASLSYTDPAGGTSTVADDKWDLWMGTTRIVTAAPATTAAGALQQIYIGSNSGKRSEIRLDNMVVTDLSPTSCANPPTASAGSANNVCQSATPSAFALTGATIGGGATTGTWSITSGGGTLSSTSAQTGSAAVAAVTYTPVANYTGTVSLLLTTDAGGAGCSAATSTRTINVNAAPTAAAGTAIISCSNTSGAVTIGTGATSTNSTVAWTSSGSGTIGSGTNLTGATYTPSAGDISAHGVTLTLTATGTTTGCTSVTVPVTKSFTINTAPSATAGGPDNLCQAASPGALTLSGASVGGGATTGAWSITTPGGGGTLSSTSQTASPDAVTYTPNANVSGNVVLTLTSNAPSGCTAVTSTRAVNVKARPASVVSGSTSSCSGASKTISVALTGTQPWALSWSDGTNTTNVTGISTSPYTFNVTPSSNTTYTVTALSDANCSAVSGDMTGSATISITPAPSISAESLSGAIYTQGATATALTVTASNATGYQWYRSSDNIVDGGDLAVGTSTNSYTPSTAAVANYYYYCVVSGSCTPPATSSVSGLIEVDAPASPTIVTDQTGFNGTFGNQLVNTSTSAQSMVVSGTNLVDDITITAPTGFEVSSTSSSAGFGSSVVLTQASGSVGNTTIYVRFSPVSAIAYSGDVILLSSGATTVNVAVSGTGINPSVALSSSSAMSFSVTGWTAATEQHVTVTGSNLIGDVTATVGAPFQVSTDGSSWGTTKTYTPTSGSVSGTLYVRYNPSSGSGSDNSTVTVSSSGATDQTISVSGKAAPSITLTSANATQSVKAGVAIANITYTVTGGVVSASASPLPSGITLNGTYQISGTPATETSYPQVYNYTVTVVGPSGTSNATASGSITVKNPNPKKIAFLYTGAYTTIQGANKLYAGLVANSNFQVDSIQAATLAADTAAQMANLKNNYDLTILHESVGSTNLAALRLGTYIGTMPILNTKAHMYGKANWPAGSGNNGARVTNASVTVNGGYSGHPIFSGVTFSGSTVTMVGASGIIRWVNGATTTNQRVIANNSAGTAGLISIMEDSVLLTGKKKYMLISLSAGDEDLTANGLLVLNNACNHLMAQSIFASAGANGSISSSGETDVATNGSKTYTITPNSGYAINTVLVDGVNNTGAVASGSYTFSSVTANHSISATFILIPCAKPTINTQPASGGESVCLNTTATTLTVAATGTGSVTYQWRQSANGTSNWTNVSGATSASLTPSTASAGTLYYHCVVTNDCGSGSTGVDSSSNSGAIIVHTAVGGTASGNSTICHGSQPNSDLTVNGITGSVTKWQYSIDNFVSDINDIANASTTLTAATIGNLTATTKFRAVVEECSAVAYSTLVTVTVSPTSVGGSASADQSICSGSTPSSLSLTGNTGNIQWQYSSVSDFSSDVHDIAGATNASYSPGALTSTTYYRAAVTSGACTAAHSNIVTITVDISQQIPLTSVAGTNNQSVCVNSAISDIVYTGNASVSGASITSGALPAGVTGSYSAGVFTITGTPTEVGTFNYTITTSGFCNIATASGTITVHALSNAGTLSVDQAVCSGSVPSQLSVTGSVGTLQWQSSTTSTTTGFTDIIGATGATYTPGALTQTTYFRVVASSNGCSSATSASAITVSVNAIPGNASGATGDTRCGTGTVNLSVTNPGTGYEVDWFSASTGGTSLYTGVTYSPSISTTTTFYAEVKDISVGCKSISRTGVTGTVNAAASISVQPSSSAANYNLSASATALTVTAAGYGTLTYQWHSSTDASNSTSGDDLVVGTNSNSYTPSTSVVGTLYYYCVVTGCSTVTSNVSGAITVSASTAKAITAFTFASQVSSTITESTHTIAVVMPSATNRSALAPTTITVSANATVSPASGVAQDFRNPVVYTVTAQDGSTQNYTVTVTNQSGAVTACAKMGYDYLTTTYPTAWTTGPTTFNSSTPREFTLTAGSPSSATVCGTTINTYQLNGSSVFVEMNLTTNSNSSTISSITFTGSSNNASANTAKAGVVYSNTIPFSLTSVIGAETSAYVPASGGAWTVLSLNPPAGTKSFRIYRSIYYNGTNTAQTGSGTGFTQYGLGQTIRLGELNTCVTSGSGSSAVKLTTPTVGSADAATNQGFTAHWTDVSNEIGYRVQVYNGSNALVKTDTLIAANATSDVVTGLSANTSYTFKVTAIGDGDAYSNSDPSSASSPSIRTLNTTKDITNFVIGGVTASIIGTNISAEVSALTDITSIAPSTVTITGASYSPSGAQNFTTPVDYTVTAEDGSTKVYTVTITKAAALSTACNITSFSIPGQLSAVFDGVVSYTVVMPYGTNLTALTPNVTVSAAASYSPIGAIDFSSQGRVITVTAEDGTTTKGYYITVTNATPDITLSSSNALNFSVTGWAASTEQTLTLNGTNLVANISATVGAPFQVSSDGSTWGTSASFTQTSGSVTNATLHIRYNPSSGTGSDNGTVTLTSTGATDKTITVNGTAAPKIVLSSGSATQSVKANVAIADIQYTVTGGVVSSGATGLPSGVTLNGTYKISGTPGTEATYPAVYSYTVTITGVSGTTAATATGTITVKDPNAKKVAFLYTSTDPAAITGTNKLYSELIKHYDVTVYDVAANNTAAYMDNIYAQANDLIVLHENVNSANLAAQRLGFYIGQVPILNTKAHMYGKTNWPAGAGQNGAVGNRSIKVLPGYANDPIFAGVTISAADTVLMCNTNGVIRWVTGATTSSSRVIGRNSQSGSGTISVMEDSVLVTTKKKYMLIAMSAGNEDFTANGLKVMVNACEHLMAQSIFASAGTNGSISPNGETDVATNGSQSYTITPATGYHIADVLVDGVSNAGAISGGSYTFTGVTGAHKISATFAINTYTISSSAGSNGSISPNGSTSVNYNGSQAYTITANSGYHVADVQVDFASVGAVTSYTFSNVTGNHDISATFAVDIPTYTFIGGGANSNFGNPDNWQGGVVPPAGTPVDAYINAPTVLTSSYGVPTGGSLTINSPGTITINPNVVLTLTGNANFNGLHVIVKSDGTGTGSIGQITGTLSGATNVTVERYIPVHAQRAWRLLSAPISGQTVNQAWQEGSAPTVDGHPGYGTFITKGNSGTGSIIPNPGNGFDYRTPYPSLQKFSGGAWVEAVSNTSASLDTKQGYFLYIRGDRSAGSSPSVSTTPVAATTLRITGSIYQGEQSSQISGSYGVVGNVYASAIDYNNVINNSRLSNVNPNYFYVWDPSLFTDPAGVSLGGYRTMYRVENSFSLQVPTTVTDAYTAPTSIVESGQAIVVGTTSSSASVTFEEADKVNTNRDVFRPMAPTSTIGQLSTNLWNSAGGLSDGNVALFGGSYTNSLSASDVPKFGKDYENFSLNKNGALLNIETRSAVSSSDTIYYDLQNMQMNKQYRLEFVGSNLDGVTGLLRDKYLGTTTPIDLGVTTSASFTTNSTVAASYARDRFSVVLRASGPLPVGIRSLTAYQSQGSDKVMISWKVGTETGVQNYEVERSTDGRTFTGIGTLNATNNNGTEASYIYGDGSVQTGTVVYYRVKMTLHNGAISYSSIAKVTLGKTASGFTIYPNPVENGEVNVLLKNEPSGKYGVRVLTVSGQSVYTGSLEHAGGSGTLPFSLPRKISAGVYTLELTSPKGGVEKIKLVIRN